MISQRIILAGGGNARQSQAVDNFFVNLLSNNNFLFVPQAISPQMWPYEKTLRWIQKPKAFGKVKITMLKDFEQLSLEYLMTFDAVYLMGGNTYKLLKVLRDTDLEEFLPLYLKLGKLVYGLSAGAIVMGAHVKTAAVEPEKDENDVGIRDLSSLNLLNGAIVATHYVEEMDDELFGMGKQGNRMILCIPETSGIFVENNNCMVIGNDPVTIINCNEKYSLQKGSEFKI